MTNTSPKPLSDEPIPFYKEWWWRVVGRIQCLPYFLSRPADDVSRWQAFWCRWRSHPHGVIYYNPNGYEPNMHCKDCGDDLG
jgi:hypothetical protein